MADTTRSSDAPAKNYVKVIHQQGRPVMDSDLNEEQDINFRQGRMGVLEHGLDASTFAESIGLPRGGKFHAGFRPKESVTTPTNNFALRAGTLWRAGKRFVLDVETQYNAQVDETGATLPALTTPISNRTDLVYLQVWEQEISAAQDSNLIHPGPGFEVTRRTKLFALVRVVEGVTTVPGPAAGRQNYPLALLQRLAGNSQITRSMIRHIPATIFVTGTSGNDARSGHYANDGLATIGEALRRVPRILNEDWKILIQPNAGGGHLGGYHEPIRLSGIRAMPRNPEDSHLSSTTSRAEYRTPEPGVAGRVRRRYELVIEPVLWESSPLLNVAIIDGTNAGSGDDWVDTESFLVDCQSVTFRGIFFNGGVQNALRLTRCDDIHMVGCAFSLAAADGLLCVQTTLRAWNILASNNSGNGIYLQGGNAVIEGDFDLFQNAQAGIGVAKGGLLEIGGDDSMGVFFSEQTSVGNRRRRSHTNASQILVEDGGQAIIGDPTAARPVQVYNGIMGIEVRTSSVADIRNVEVGPVTAAGLTPSGVGIQIANGSTAFVTDVYMNGGMLTGAIGIRVFNNSDCQAEGLLSRDYEGHGLDVGLQSHCTLQATLGAQLLNQCVFEFSGSNTSAEIRVRVRRGSTLSVAGATPSVATDPMTIIDPNVASAGNQRGLYLEDHSSVLVGGTARLWFRKMGPGSPLVVEIRNGSQFVGSDQCRFSSTTSFPGSPVNQHTHFATEGTTRGASGHGYNTSGQQEDPHHCSVASNSNGVL